MKARSVFIFVFVVSLILLSTWAVSAQGPKPTATSPSGRMMQPPPNEPMATYRPPLETVPSFDGANQRTSSGGVVPRASFGSPRSPKVALGQPGLSFRYVQTFGVTGQAYPPPGNYLLNAPSGLFIDASNNVYVTEDRGYRVLGYNSAGTNILALGVPGWCVGTSTNPIGFCAPQDVAKDSGGNLWVADGGNRVVQFNPSGTYLQQLPPTNAWYGGNDNTHFYYVTGIAFDNVAGRMFVADAPNHRVQVYTFSGGAPVYNATIGVTGVSGNDSSHFNYPHRLAVDSTGRLYVADTNNNRVQRCSFSGIWNCVTFASGLNFPEGIGLDSLGNVFIADTRNAKIKKCDSGGSCVDFIGFPSWTHDVAIDSGGIVYVSDWDHKVIRKYNNTGISLGNFVGTMDVPYPVDSTRLNAPWGIAIGSDNSIYVSENNGQRVIKLNASGSQLWTVGQAGVTGGWNFGDNTHFNFPQGIASDSAGRVYVADQYNNRVQVYNSDGTFSSTFGSYGNGVSQLNCSAGISISPVNGDVYIADRCNQRIQVYDSSLTIYRATLGTTSTPGSDGTHFNNPNGVVVDAGGNVFVADTNNHRVQKCTVSGYGGTCTTFIGQTGVPGSDFDHLNTPLSVAIDRANHLYVVDQWNNRVQVFDSSGAYLTTIGGNWGNNTGQLRGPSGIALDSSGNVYVTDRVNNRVQKYSPGVPGWLQSNINGFGIRSNQIVTTLSPFNGQLYAGTYNGNGAQLWRLSPGSTWSSVITPGFGITRNVGFDHLFPFNNRLYAGIGADTVVGGQVWRSDDGTTWNQMTLPGFDTTNGEVFRFAAFNNKIYASTWSYTNTHGVEIWRSDTGDSGTWTRVVSNGFGDANNETVPAFEVFNGLLYAGTFNWNRIAGVSGGGQVWRTGDGTTWNQVNVNGFGSADNNSIHALASFNGNLYAAATNFNVVTKTSTGGKIWRCAVCNGSDWSLVVSDGFGTPNNDAVDTLILQGNILYAGTVNHVTGMEIWKTTDGTTWTPFSIGGFGNGNNESGYWDNAVTVFNNQLYYGTNNWADGGQVWQTENLLYLPLIMR